MPKLTCLCLIAALTVIVGCSADSQTIHSTIHRPRSVAVVDTTTKDTLWSMDIPVQYSLVLNFNNNNDITAMRLGESPATSFNWALYRLKDLRTSYMRSDEVRPPKGRVAADRVALGGHPIRIEVTFRDSPEFPGVVPVPSVHPVVDPVVAVPVINTSSVIAEDAPPVTGISTGPDPETPPTDTPGEAAKTKTTDIELVKEELEEEAKEEVEAIDLGPIEEQDEDEFKEKITDYTK